MKIPSKSYSSPQSCACDRPAQISALLFVTLLSLGFDTRFVCSFYPVSLKGLSSGITDEERIIIDRVLERHLSRQLGKHSSHSSSPDSQGSSKISVPSAPAQPSHRPSLATSLDDDDEFIEEGEEMNQEEEEGTREAPFYDDVRSLLLSHETSTAGGTEGKHSMLRSPPNTSSPTPEVTERVAVFKLKPGLSVNSKPHPQGSSSRQSNSSSARASPKDDTVKEPKTNQRKGIDCWVEVFLVSEERWIPVCPLSSCIDKPYDIGKATSQPICYVLGFQPVTRNTGCHGILKRNSSGYVAVKDLTSKYTTRWGSFNRKLRIEWFDSENGANWYKSLLAPYASADTGRDEEEDLQILLQMRDLPLPTSIADFKDHPLYVLRRHLLKYECIWPEDSAPCGVVRGESVYARSLVRPLHTKETWMKQGLVIKQGELPVKFVKSMMTNRKKKMREMAGQELPEVGLYGKWQVELYKSPPVKDGIVPRNSFGNVELFRQTMLPPGGVYLNLQGLDKIAAQLEIDCVPAMLGWQFRGGRATPVIEGFVVATEFEHVLRDSWQAKRDEASLKLEREKEARVLRNWTRLVRAARISHKLATKYQLPPDEPRVQSGEK